MIIDNINNFGNYKLFDDKIYSGLKYLIKIPNDIQMGSYQISENIKVIIEGYYTRESNDNIFEVHERTLDIQYPLVGQEKVLWARHEQNCMVSEYDPKHDRKYVTLNNIERIEIATGQGIFAIFYPNEPHKPCLSINGQKSLIKKATVKIKFR